MMGIDHGSTRDSYDRQKAIYYYEKARDNHRSNDFEQGVQAMQSAVNLLKSSDPSNRRGREERLAGAFQFFNNQVEKEGARSAETINAAMVLASSFSLADHGIEAERLITKYAPISHRVHGEEHRTTKDVESVLLRCKARLVMLENEEEYLNDEDGGDKCVKSNLLF